MNRDEMKTKALELTGRMTLEEKVGMIHGAHIFVTEGVERLGIPPLVMSDGPMGVRQELEPDHLKPLGNSDDYATYLPSNSAIASTWNRELAFAAGSVLGEEARGRGKDIILAPGINIKRSPLCGRNFEYFSEDPYLTGELAVQYIQGVQQWDVAACVKHFAVNNQETQRFFVDVEIDEKALREIYLSAFYECITRGGCLSIMGAYNKIYGEYCCQSRRLLGDILRGEWGYDGVVVSDWGAVHDMELAAMSELDVEMSIVDDFGEYLLAEPLIEAVKQGKIPEAKIDEKVVRILMLMMKLNMLAGKETPVRKRGSYNSPEHRQAALDVAREAVVLLKNDSNILPLDIDKVKKVLVVGENAVRLHANGGGSAEIKALYEISPLMGIKKLLGGGAKVDFLKGYDSSADKCENMETVAAAKAKAYDAVIFVGGLNHDYDGEGFDRKDMKLPYGQDMLIRELLEARPDTILTFLGGSPVEMGEWIDRADTVLWSYYAGMEGGTALAEAVFGKINPSGKLAETFYKTHMDCSAHALGEFAGEKSAAYREGIFVGYRYNETFGAEPEFCFGHGLSYTEFTYKDAVYEESDEGSYVTCSITNTGSIAGAEAVQIYRMINDGRPSPDSPRPVKELAGFGKLYLEPGETGQVKIWIKGNKGSCSLGIGSSVKDIRIVL